MDTPRRPGVVETATLDSEISMSVATDDTRTFRAEENQLRRPSQAANVVSNTHHDVAMSASAVSSSDSRSVLRRLSINAEPAIFLYAIVFGVLLTNAPTYLYWARCSQLYEADPQAPTWDGERNASAVCANLAHKNFTTFQNDVEKDIATAKIWLQVANSVPTIITAPLIGMWSDGSGGRRMPLLISLFGLFLYPLIYLGSSLSYSWLNVYYVLFVAEISNGCLGGIPTLFSSSLAIVTDETRLSHKLQSSTISFKICFASAIQVLGIVIGNLIVSIISQPAVLDVEGHKNGYIYAFVVAALVALAAFVFSLLFVRETHSVPYPVESTLILSTTVSPSSSVGFRKKVKAFIYDLVEVVVARRPGWTRFCLNISIMFVFVEFLAMDNQLLFLMVKKSPFNWSDQLFAEFSIFKSVASSVGMIVAPLVLMKCAVLGKDSLLIMIGVMASFVFFAILAFADSTYLVFVAGAVNMLTGCIAPGYRSFLPRMVAKEETARVLTVFGLVIAFSPIIATSVFNSVYKATIDYWPGMAFLLAAGFNLVVLFGQLLIHALLYPLWLRDEQLRSTAVLGRSGTLDDEDILSEYVPGSEPRSVSNTAVNSEMDSMEDDRRPLIP